MPKRLPLERIAQMRATLGDSFKALKKAYACAKLPTSNNEDRKKANTLLAAVRKNMEEVVDEYNEAIDNEMTEFEERAANELLTELKVYKEYLEGHYVTLRMEPTQVPPIN